MAIVTFFAYASSACATSITDCHGTCTMARSSVSDSERGGMGWAARRHHNESLPLESASQISDMGYKQTDGRRMERNIQLPRKPEKPWI